MAKVQPFELYTEDYENWFERNRNLYLSELNLLKELLRGFEFQKGIEVGIGSGRFAKPLGVQYGIDPSPKMLKIAKKRGLKVALGVAENLPLKSSIADFTLMVTTICFVDDPIASLKEIDRITKGGGRFLIGFVDKNSFLGKLYEKKKPFSRFYKPATFFSSEEILKLTEENTSFKLIRAGQTIFSTENRIYPPKEGYGEGAFVGLLFKKV